MTSTKIGATLAMTGAMLAAAGLAMAQGAPPAPPTPPTPPAPPAPPAASAPAAPPARAQAAPSTDDRTPMVRVHVDGPRPENTADRRVRLADGTVISVGSTVGVVNGVAVAPAVGTPSPASPVRPDGSIVMPDNTAGAGEPYWHRMERLDAQRRLAEAEADRARAAADRAERGRYTLIDRAWAVEGSGYTLWSGPGAAPIFDGYRGGFGGPGYRDGVFNGPIVGPFPPTVSVREDDTLGATARRNFAEAARPRINDAQNARDAIHRDAGNAALPPVGRIQNDVDEAHRRGNTEQTPR
jgi:hypothetical protein